MSVTIGLVGCGRWGANILRDLTALGATVVVAERHDVRREHALSKGAHAAVATAGELPRCDGYVVATEASAHRSVCELLLERGVPVYVEKPPCTTLEDVAALAALGGDRLLVMHKWRYHPGVVALRDLLARGDIGVPLRLETQRVGPEPLPPDADVIWHLAVHDLAIALEVLGAVPAVHRADGRFDGDGRLVWCRATFAVNPNIEYVLEVAADHPDRRRSIRLVGSDGAAVLERPDAPDVTVFTRGSAELVSLPDHLPLERELAAFVEHCGGGPAPKSSVSDALAICTQLAAVDALVRS